MSKPYKRVVEYHFEIRGEVFAVTGFASSNSAQEPQYVCIRETECNGQEDTHVSGVLELGENGWHWVKGMEMFLEYRDEETIDAIIEFFNKNGLPE